MTTILTQKHTQTHALDFESPLTPFNTEISITVEVRKLPKLSAHTYIFMTHETRSQLIQI